MLTALMTGGALTASELAHEAGITQQTASSHLAKLEHGGLVTLQKQGRHRYFRLSGPDVPVVLEALMGLAARAGHLRVRTGPRDPALRRARVCYDHLAGDLGVELFDSLVGRRLLTSDQHDLAPTPKGERFLAAFGIDLDAARRGRRPFCRVCLDWSARRSHLAGSLGAALLDRCFELRWARREEGTRIVSFSRAGEASFAALLGRAG